MPSLTDVQTKSYDRFLQLEIHPEERENLGLEGDAATGADIVRRAVRQPLRWIAENAGQDGFVVVSKVEELELGQGYNAATGEYGDLIGKGVIDPVKVTRSALRNAASIASMILTTDTLVVEKKDDDDDAKPDQSAGAPSAGPAKDA